MASKHRPNFVLGMLSELVACFSLPRPERFRMDANITFFHDCHGKCERILKTPIPLSYTRSGSYCLYGQWQFCVKPSPGQMTCNGSFCAKGGLLCLLDSSALRLLMQAHLKVSGHLVNHHALYSVEELSLVHGTCCIHHLLLAAVH